jgi:hypothetical protein
MFSKIVPRRREEFSVRRSEEDIFHVVFDKEDDRIVQFSVQYLAFLQDEWHPVIRFDTAHGHAHLDISHPDDTQETRELHIQNYNEALTWALEDLREHWQFYRQRYEQELEQ